MCIRDRGWASQPPNCTPSQENPTEPQQPGREMSFSEKLQIMSTLKQELSAHLVGAQCCSEFNENIWSCSSLTSNAVPTQICHGFLDIWTLHSRSDTLAGQTNMWLRSHWSTGGSSFILEWKQNNLKIFQNHFCFPSIYCKKKLPPESMWKTRLRIRIWVFMSWHIRREAQW